jgi:serpin B
MGWGRILPVIVLAGFITAPVSFTQVPEEPSSVNTPEDDIAASVNEFGLKLFQELCEEEKDSNVFISPLSVSMALTMVLNGAESETARAMASTLELAGLSRDRINESYEKLNDQLTTIDTAVVFKIANSIWYREEIAVEQSFLNVNQAFFDARISPGNFGDPGTADTINAWVGRNTKDKIPTIVEKPINPNLVMILINAIYFDGNWAHQFDKEYTHDDEFSLPDGSKTSCKMMSQEKRFRYLESDSFQAVDLPYGDGAFSMIIFLPKPGVRVDNFIGHFHKDSLEEWLGNLVMSNGTIYLPKFKLEYESNLSEILASLGMGIAFSGGADFSGINKEGLLFISFVKHKTFIEVDEEGTEAAAVTSVGMATSAGPSEGFVMRMDRPFLLLIRENNSQAILFIGKIVEPEAG